MSSRAGLRIFALAVAAAVGLSILAGLLASGSPRTERLRRMDGQRLEDLRQIASAVDTYWSENHRLPAQLTETLGPPGAMRPLPMRDPRTGAPYEYRPLDSLAYELCAVFDTDSSAGPYGPVAFDPRIHRHPRGRGCFTLQVRQFGPSGVGRGPLTPR